MKTKIKITFLGTGSALGVPQFGCDCHVNTSSKKVNKRKRTCFFSEHLAKPSLWIQDLIQNFT